MLLLWCFSRNSRLWCQNKRVSHSQQRRAFWWLLRSAPKMCQRDAVAKLKILQPILARILKDRANIETMLLLCWIIYKTSTKKSFFFLPLLVFFAKNACISPTAIWIKILSPNLIQIRVFHCGAYLLWFLFGTVPSLSRSNMVLSRNAGCIFSALRPLYVPPPRRNNNSWSTPECRHRVGVQVSKGGHRYQISSIANAYFAPCSVHERKLDRTKKCSTGGALVLTASCTK